MRKTAHHIMHCAALWLVKTGMQSKQAVSRVTNSASLCV
jgi:hypothetical protein